MCAILVPVGAPKSAPPQQRSTTSEPPGPSRGSLRGALTSLFRGRDSRAPADTVEALVEETAVAAKQVRRKHSGAAQGCLPTVTFQACCCPPLAPRSLFDGLQSLGQAMTGKCLP